MSRDADDTVIIRRARRKWPMIPVLVALGCVVAAGMGGLIWMRLATSPPSLPPIPAATEAELRAESPTTRTVLRFALNPAILVLDFPTLAEQGEMLNRIAAWEERAGVPRDHLLADAELDVAIRAGGSTPETYYYGHDYSAAEIARFFAHADLEHIALNPREQELRALVSRAAAEPQGFGALITLPRADAANQVDASSRAAILHHELSHGEYFTNPVFARSIKTIWDSVLTASERSSFRTYLATEGYDSGIEDLMMNETQAYLMHTPDPRFFDPSRLGIATERLTQIKKSFLAAMPAGWLRDETTIASAP